MAKRAFTTLFDSCKRVNRLQPAEMTTTHGNNTGITYNCNVHLTTKWKMLPFIVRDCIEPLLRVLHDFDAGKGETKIFIF